LRIVERIAEMPLLKGKVGFVPTMGAFHEGHLQLMRTARQACDHVVVSLFVNPTQFGPSEDFSKYPRNPERDLDLAQSAGVDIMFMPPVAEMYSISEVKVTVARIGELWEGRSRPGHYDGVATIVAKLFNIVAPNIAYFGLKDLQQCMVIRALVDSLNYRIELSFEPTVRESDGLAMSSRNVYLSSSDRMKATMIYAELCQAKSAIEAGAYAASALKAGVTKLQDSGFLVDYFSLVHLPNMNILETPTDGAAIIAAARLGSTRLIDNIVF
jgi:pantoate--beta-alanine ligase